MAEGDSRRTRGGAQDELTRERHSWGYCFTGTRAALIGEGVVSEGSFPGDAGQRKTVVRFRLDDGRVVEVMKESRDRFSASVPFTEAEASEAERLDEQEREAEEARRFLERLPKNTDEFRADAARDLDLLLFRALERVLLELGGLRFADDVRERVTAHLRAAVEAVRTGTVLVDARTRWDLLSDLRERARQ